MPNTDWKRILELCAKATPGPWDPVVSTWAVRYLGPSVATGPSHGDYICAILQQRVEGAAMANKDFIAAARTALPEAARAMVALEEWRERYASYAQYDEVSAGSVQDMLDAIERGEGPKR